MEKNNKYNKIYTGGVWDGESLEKRYEDKTVFGGKRVGICRAMHMGSNSLLESVNLTKGILGEKKWNFKDLDKTFVILLRDPYERWFNAILEELYPHFTFYFGHNGDEYNEEDFVSLCELIFAKPWRGFFTNHGAVGNWIDTRLPYSKTFTLVETISMENVFYLPLSDLSSPKFLEWLQEKDDTWREIKEIKHSTTARTDRKWFRKYLFKFLESSKPDFRIDRPELWEKFQETELLRAYFKQETELIRYLLTTSKYIEL